MYQREYDISGDNNNILGYREITKPGTATAGLRLAV